MLKAIFMWIYCMDFHEALILLTTFTGLLYAAKVKLGLQRIWKLAVILGLFMWAASVVIQTIFQRTPDASLQPIWQPFQSYVDALKEGGQKELLRSNFMNAVLFYPAGLLLVSLLPEKWHSRRSLLIVLLLCTGFSLAIEFAQYRYHLGLVQTDDVIHNALGAYLGAAVFLLIPKVIKQIRIRRGEIV